MQIKLVSSNGNFHVDAILDSQVIMAVVKTHDLNVWNPKPPAFIIFADLDGTFTPMDIHGKIDFANVIKEIHDKGGVQVKFVPVSGRPAGYVLRVLHDTRDMLESMQVGKVCDFGAAEQGALVVDCSKSYGPQFLGNPENIGLKQRVNEILKHHPHHAIVQDEPDKLYTCSIHILNEIKETMSNDEKRKIYESIKADILKEYPPGVLDIAMSHNCMEVMSKEISKANAMDVLLDRYRKEYNVVGIMYAGDAENDKNAIIYTSKLAEIPGMKAHVFEPSNAQAVVDSEHLEGWKEKNPAASKHRIRKGDYRLFKGITQLIRDELDNGTLFGAGSGVRQSLDDFVLPLRQKLLNVEEEEEDRHAQQKAAANRKLSHLEPISKHLITKSGYQYLSSYKRRTSGQVGLDGDNDKNNNPASLRFNPSDSALITGLSGAKEMPELSLY